MEEAVKEAQETMGVEFVYDVDKEAFREATQPMIEASRGSSIPASRRCWIPSTPQEGRGKP